MKNKNNKSQRHPCTVPGDFYAECLRSEECNRCFLPQLEAPTLVGYVNAAPYQGQCFFKRQPETAEEIRQASEAIEMACCESLRYGGRDEEIIAGLQGFNCDDV